MKVHLPFGMTAVKVASGTWEVSLPGENRTTVLNSLKSSDKDVEDVLTAAVQLVVHEVLERTTFDGDPAVRPHGKDKDLDKTIQTAIRKHFS